MSAHEKRFEVAVGLVPGTGDRQTFRTLETGTEKPRERQRFNLNDRIHFELTPEGVKKWEELAQAERERCRFPERYTRKTPVGPTATSMWDFMQFFGEALTLGSPVYLVDGCFEMEKS